MRIWMASSLLPFCYPNQGGGGRKKRKKKRGRGKENPANSTLFDARKVKGEEKKKKKKKNYPLLRAPT